MKTIFKLGIFFFIVLPGFKCYADGFPVAWLEKQHCTIALRLTRHDYEYYSRPVCTTSTIIDKNGKHEIQFQNTRWEAFIKTSLPGNRTDAVDFEVVCKLVSGKSPQTSVSVDFTFGNWSPSNYVLMPAAVYNGNRFESRRIRYSPKLLDNKDIGPDKPQIISDVPRLNVGDGASRIQERSGAMSVPAIGFHSAETRTVFWLLTDQATKFGDTGIGTEESRDRKSAVISLTVPVVRENTRYTITDNQAASEDRAPDYDEGNEITLRFRVFFFPALHLQDLFDRFTEIRKDQVHQEPSKSWLPFSSCFAVQESKFNLQNWVEEYGYYSVGMRENFLQDWQIGWTGGMISTYPLLMCGSDTTREHVRRNFEWLFPSGISPSGFFWDSGEKGNRWYGGDIRRPHTRNWHLVRKSGDGLYYIVKQLMLMKQKGMAVKPEWEKGTQTVADAFVKLWDRWGQFGQFVDSQTGDVVVGGSTSGAIVPAALTLAARYFNNRDYMRVAEAAGDYYYQNFIKKGITCGGPGDALQNPDSESGYAMVESYMLLYDTTLEPKWLQMAAHAANQFTTWVMACDYRFPENSTLGRRGVQTTGTVFANTQNKHAAPGICTYSGIALWRLFRATGQTFYMELLRDIARVMPQYLSHPLRPIDQMKAGWMSERVNTTDWLEGIGELMVGSTWAETSLMLSYAELPGVYIQPDKSYVIALDNIETRITEDKPRLLTVRLTNPSPAPASVRLFVESSAQAQRPLGENALLNCSPVFLQPGESRTLSFRKKL